MTWQPIETAPKDGTRIWATNGVMDFPVVVEWLDYRGEIVAVASKEWVCVADPHERWMPMIGRMVCPTLWQHLPTKPKV